MTDVESFKRQTGVKIDYRQFNIDELAPALILQAPPPAATAPEPPTSEFKPPAPPGPAAAPSSGFARYAPPESTSDGTLLSELFKRLERQ